MEIVISHISALAFWLAQPSRRDYPLTRRSTGTLPSGPFGDRDAEYAALVLPREASSVIHVIAKDSRKRSNGRFRVHSHTTGLSSGSIIRVSDEILVCSPELALMQSAPTLSDVDFIRAGYQLCGTYRLNDDQSLYSAEPLTTPAKLTASFNKADRQRGAKRSRQLAQFILANSASPRETMLAMHLSLPYRLGGLGLPAPVLNPTLKLTSFQQSLAGKQHLAPDLYWPASKVEMEYDSDEFHTGSRKIALDSHRRDVLSHLGIREISVTRLQFDDLVAFNKVAHITAKAVGHRINPRRSDFAARQFDLRAQLLAPFPFETGNMSSRVRK